MVHEVTWDEYELWMLNLDKDNREYNKIEKSEGDDLADAVTKPTSLRTCPLVWARAGIRRFA